VDVAVSVRLCLNNFVLHSQSSFVVNEGRHVLLLYNVNSVLAQAKELILLKKIHCSLVCIV
jgi:hypothetical protein